MSATSGSLVLSQLQWRYATKKFDSSRRISSTDWHVLEQVLVLSPSSYGLQPWRFYVVTDPAVKARLPVVSWGQKQPQECSHMVVLAIRRNLGRSDIDRFIDRTAEVRGVATSALDGFRRMLIGNLENPSFDINEWAAKQVYIALGQFMACAAMMGIDTCPMEGINPAKYDEILGIPSAEYTTCVACAAGYRDTTDRTASLPKVRYETDEVIHRI